MGKRFWMYAVIVVMMGLWGSLEVYADLGDSRKAFTHDQKEAHKEIREKIKEYEERGYKQENIRKAILIAKHANVDPQKVLDTYQMTNSWQVTAKSFGVDYEDIKQHHRILPFP